MKTPVLRSARTLADTSMVKLEPQQHVLPLYFDERRRPQDNSRHKTVVLQGEEFCAPTFLNLWHFENHFENSELDFFMWQRLVRTANCDKYGPFASVHEPPRPGGKVRPCTSASYYFNVEATRQNLFWPDLPNCTVV